MAYDEGSLRVVFKNRILLVLYNIMKSEVWSFPPLEHYAFPLRSCGQKRLNSNSRVPLRLSVYFLFLLNLYNYKTIFFGISRIFYPPTPIFCLISPGSAQYGQSNEGKIMCLTDSFFSRFKRHVKHLLSFNPSPVQAGVDVPAPLFVDSKNSRYAGLPFKGTSFVLFLVYYSISYKGFFSMDFLTRYLCLFPDFISLSRSSRQT